MSTELRIAQPYTGKSILLLWYSHDEGHHVILSPDQAGALVCWEAVLGKNPEAEIKEYWEAIIVPPDDYANWMPMAGKDEDTVGNTIRVRIERSTDSMIGFPPWDANWDEIADELARLVQRETERIESALRPEKKP